MPSVKLAGLLLLAGISTWVSQVHAEGAYALFSGENCTGKAIYFTEPRSRLGDPPTQGWGGKSKSVMVVSGTWVAHHGEDFTDQDKMSGAMVPDPGCYSVGFGINGMRLLNPGSGPNDGRASNPPFNTQQVMDAVKVIAFIVSLF